MPDPTTPPPAPAPAPAPAEPSATDPSEPPGSSVARKVDQEEILDALRTVKDPELGVNVVDLGLIYTIQSREGEIDVEMTLTTPACPAGPEILRNAVSALRGIHGIDRADVRLVMSPPWSPDRMSDAARDELGIF